MIFLSITGSFSAAVIYDKRERKRAQRKWCKVVEHLAKEHLDAKVMPRRLTIFLEGPPGDGLRVAQEHFKEYVKPVLVSSGLDWEFIQGRKEGDVRAELAEKIRGFRTPDAEVVEEDVIARIRKNNQIVEFDGPRGDIVIGRHTWKEYVRGLHEGWLGPIKPLSMPEPEKPTEDAEPIQAEKIETLPGITIHSTPVDSDVAPADPPPEKLAEDTKKPPQPIPFISTAEYQSAPTPANPSTVLRPFYSNPTPSHSWILQHPPPSLPLPQPPATSRLHRAGHCSNNSGCISSLPYYINRTRNFLLTNIRRHLWRRQ